ncbi:MAG: DMT family transporter [Alphaproteobacteria bacterium]
MAVAEPPVVEPAAARPRQLRGIAFMLTSGAIFAFTDALAKVLTSDYSAGQILCLRTIFVLIAIMVMVRLRGGVASVRVVNWKGHLLRGLFMAATTLTFLLALKDAPLADLFALMFVSPLILTILAPYFLGERVGWRRRVAVAIGFCGTLVIVQPTGEVPFTALMLGLAVPFFLCFSDIVTRVLARTDTANSMMLFSNIIMGAVGLALLPFGWTTPDWQGLLIIGVMGALQGIAQYFLVYAFIHAETVTIVPFRYLMLIWAMAYGYLMFGDIPRWETIIGAAIVVAAGLYIFHREARYGQA